MHFAGKGWLFVRRSRDFYKVLVTIVVSGVFLSR